MISVNFLDHYSQKRIQSSVVSSKDKKQKKFSLKAILSSVLLFSLLVPSVAPLSAQESTLSSPTLLSLTHDQKIASNQFIINGLTAAGSEVEVYIDDALQGSAQVKESLTGTASFSFHPDALDPGIHTLSLVSVSESKRSAPSKPITVHVFPPTPAPTLFPFLAGAEYSRPWIRGISKNNTVVSLYIDGKKDQEIALFESSGLDSVSFSVKPSASLKPGWHSLYTRAKNTHGIESSVSENVSFLISDPNGALAQILPEPREVPSPVLSVPSAPTLFEIGKEGVVKTPQPTITGVAHNDLNVKLFIDGQLNQEMTAESSSTGVVGFSLTPFLPLAPGFHSITTKAQDPHTGATSSWSNQIHIFVEPRGSVPLIRPSGISSFSTLPKPIGSESQAPTEPSVPDEDSDTDRQEDTLSEPSDQTDSGEEVPLITPEEPITIKDPEVIPPPLSVVGQIPDEAAQDEQTDVVSQDPPGNALPSESQKTDESTQNKRQTGLIILIILALIIFLYSIWILFQERKQKKSISLSPPPDTRVKVPPPLPEPQTKDPPASSPVPKSPTEKKPIKPPGPDLLKGLKEHNKKS